ncbi:MAG: hypothetical protein ACXW2T_01340 [Allosphingosinicella sp.]
MLALIQYYFITLIAALLIGVATGWWIYRRPASRPSNRPNEDSPQQ